MLRCLAMLLALAPVALAVPASAHGPTRQKVAETVEINAPADKVWSVIGNFQDMSWHPAVTKTEGEGGSDAGAKRTLTLESGVINEELLDVDAEKKMLRYKITEVDVKVLPVNNYTAWLSVAEEGGKSVVTWRAAFYRGYMNNDPPAELNDEAAIKAVKGVFRSGLDNLKKVVEAGG